tara:strand:- start:1849 stop:2334 length:486 start_codon:yes stop_codon:yes gene_type:complete
MSFVIECDFSQNTMGYKDGKTFFVDAEDYDKFVGGYDFCCRLGYAVFSSTSSIYYCKLLHRVIMEAPDGMDVDHIDGNTLNNRKSNLRVCSHHENLMNRKKHKNNKSGVKGVSWYKNLNKWHAQIQCDKKIHLGYYDDFDEAVKVRKEAEEKYFGEFNRKI